MPSASECLRAIDKAAGGLLDDDTLSGLIEELQRVARSRAAQEGLETVEAAMFRRAGEIAKDIKLAAAIEKRNRWINIVKQAELRDLVRRADEATGDPSLGLEAATVGVNARFTGARLSVDSQAMGIRNATMGGVVHDLRKAGLLPLFNSRSLDREISRELWDLSLAKPLGNATNSRQAKQIARILHKYRRALVMQENRAGAYIRFKQGYVVRQSHNRNRMMREGVKAWSAFMKKRMDWDAMAVAPEDQDKFLRSAFGALVTGERKDFNAGRDSDLLFGFKGPGNLGKRASAHRTLLFRNADAWFDYNERFGMSSLTEAYVADVSRAANNIALMNKFGTNPRAMFDKVRRAAALKFRDKDVAKAKRLRRAALDWYMDEVDGTASIPANYGLATASRATRAIISASRLGMATISAVTDLAFYASERRYQGRTVLQSISDSIWAPVRGWTSREIREHGDLLGVGLNSMIGSSLDRFAAQDDAPGRISKAMGLFFKLNLLTPWTDGVQRDVGVMMARDLALNADKALGALDAPMQRMLGQYGFDERMWQVARQAIAKTPEGARVMMPGEVDHVSGAVFTGLSQAQQQRLKDQTKVALAAMINERVTFAAPTPGARERALLAGGTRPGTPLGEAARFIMQFKSFPITVVSKVQGRDLYGRGARSFSDALLRGEGDLLGLATTIAHSMALGYVALQAKELAKGRELREDLGLEMVVAAMLQGGGLGIYGDFLLGEASRFGGSPLETAAGPLAGSIDEAITMAQGALHGTIRGEPPDLWARTVRLIRSNTPGANLFYTKAALDYLIFFQLQEMANPGYLGRVERRMRRENNQQFIVPPTRAIPYGGGNRIFEGVRG